jgi:MFS family permease
MPQNLDSVQAPINRPGQVLFASLVGTTIEFFDFYIYATAAVLVFPQLFFPAGDPTSATLASLATFGIAFLARPLGSALFGRRPGRAEDHAGGRAAHDGRVDGDHRVAARI